MKKHGKELAKNEYMQSMMRIQDELRVAENGRKTSSYFNTRHKRGSYVSGHAVHEGMRSELSSTKFKSAQTASFGGL